MAYSNPETQKNYQLKWIHKRRDSWIESQGGECIECGSNDRLEVDHIDPTTKELTPAGIWSRNATTRAAELAKCQVLCYGCHKAKTRTEQWKVVHGDYGMYKSHKCRCEPCRGANAARVRRTRAAKLAHTLNPVHV